MTQLFKFPSTIESSLSTNLPETFTMTHQNRVGL